MRGVDDTVDALCVFFFLKCVFGDVGVMLRFNCYSEPRSKEKKITIFIQHLSAFNYAPNSCGAATNQMNT